MKHDEESNAKRVCRSTISRSDVMKTSYDGRTAVTFLMIGLGVGALLSLFRYPGREKQIPTGKDSSKTTGLDRMSA